jgi:hypothetical protein
LIFKLGILNFYLQTTEIEMSFNTRSTRTAECGKVCKGILVLDIQSPYCNNPLARQRKQIPIRYWLVKQADPATGYAEWRPSTCQDNTITDYRGQQLQFRIHNRAKYGKFLPAEFLQLCKGPASEVVCDGLLDKVNERNNYYPYTMNFCEHPDWMFFMACDSSCMPIDY